MSNFINFVPPADAQLWCVFRSSFAPSKGGLCCKLTTSRVGPLLIQLFDELHAIIVY